MWIFAVLDLHFVARLIAGDSGGAKAGKKESPHRGEPPVRASTMRRMRWQEGLTWGFADATHRSAL